MAPDLPDNCFGPLPTALIPIGKPDDAPCKTC